ncbi:hypothetical protein M8J76_006930 [Diaphorina citri]|nr:hypothetical protein M8J76_006930 [Diaphorina citri]
MSFENYFEYLYDMNERRGAYERTNYLQLVVLCLELLPLFKKIAAATTATTPKTRIITTVGSNGGGGNDDDGSGGGLSSLTTTTIVERGGVDSRETILRVRLVRTMIV